MPFYAFHGSVCFRRNDIMKNILFNWTAEKMENADSSLAISMVDAYRLVLFSLRRV